MTHRPRLGLGLPHRVMILQLALEDAGFTGLRERQANPWPIEPQTQRKRRLKIYVEYISRARV